MVDEKRPATEHNIWINSLCSHRTMEPLVAIHMDDFTIQVTPDKAREVGRMLMECAEASEQDAFMLHFVQKELAQDINTAGQMLMMFRKWREDRPKGG